jgi:hypothetical protein
MAKEYVRRCDVVQRFVIPKIVGGQQVPTDDSRVTTEYATFLHLRAIGHLARPTNATGKLPGVWRLKIPWLS